MIDRTKAPTPSRMDVCKLPEIETSTLANGIVLHSYSGGDQPLCRLQLSFAGGKCELDNPAVQSIYAAMITEGTELHSAEEIAEKLDFYGVRWDMDSNSHFTGPNVGMLCSHVPEIMGIMKEIYSCPAFPEKEFEAIRRTAIASLNVRRRHVIALATEALMKMICGPEHPCAHFMQVSDIENLTRVDLSALHRQLSVGQGTHAFLGGALTPDIVSAVVDFLESIPQGECVQHNILPFASEAPGRTDSHLEGAVQSAIAVGFPTIARSHPDYHALRLTVMALGGYFGSRLMTNVREEKGLTYGINSRLAGMREGTYFGICAQCDPSYTSAVIDAIAEEMLKLRTEPPTGEELERLRLHAMTDALEVLDSPEGIIGYYNTAHELNFPDTYFADQQTQIAALTPEIIADMATRYLDPEQLRISVAM